MRKILLMFISIFFIACSGMGSYVNGDTKNEMMMRGVTQLMSEQEKQDFFAGKTGSFVLYKAPFRGILAQAVKVATEALPHQNKIEEVASYIYKYQDKIIVSDNSKNIQEAIEYMGTTERGRLILPNCRFVFLNYVSREKIEDLSKRFGFKYSYPKVEDVKK